MKGCQEELHAWRAANQVAFDAGKESRHILSFSESLGDGFKLLGVSFDEELTMDEAVSEIVSAAGWKMKTLVRTRRFYTDADLIILYKAHLLSFLEYRTPAVYHATKKVLNRLDAIQTRFLKNVGVDEITALSEFKLAPLAMRRDVAMLGLIHRTVLGKGPVQFKEFFKRQGESLQDPRKDHRAPVIKRSALGLVAIYNLLPASYKKAKSVSTFQKGLQDMVCNCATNGHPEWRDILSPRVCLSKHPIASLF